MKENLELQEELQELKEQLLNGDGMVGVEKRFRSKTRDGGMVSREPHVLEIICPITGEALEVEYFVC